MPAPTDPKKNECFAVLVGYGRSRLELAGAAEVHVPRDGFTLANLEQAEI